MSWLKNYLLPFFRERDQACALHPVETTAALHGSFRPDGSRPFLSDLGASLENNNNNNIQFGGQLGSPPFDDFSAFIPESAQLQSATELVVDVMTCSTHYDVEVRGPVCIHKRQRGVKEEDARRKIIVVPNATFDVSSAISGFLRNNGLMACSVPLNALFDIPGSPAGKGPSRSTTRRSSLQAKRLQGIEQDSNHAAASRKQNNAAGCGGAGGDSYLKPPKSPAARSRSSRTTEDFVEDEEGAASFGGTSRNKSNGAITTCDSSSVSRRADTRKPSANVSADGAPSDHVAMGNSVAAAGDHHDERQRGPGRDGGSKEEVLWEMSGGMTPRNRVGLWASSVPAGDIVFNDNFANIGHRHKPRRKDRNAALFRETLKNRDNERALEVENRRRQRQAATAIPSFSNPRRDDLEMSRLAALRRSKVSEAPSYIGPRDLPEYIERETHEYRFYRHMDDKTRHVVSRGEDRRLSADPGFIEGPRALTSSSTAKVQRLNTELGRLSREADVLRTRSRIRQKNSACCASTSFSHRVLHGGLTSLYSTQTLPQRIKTAPLHPGQETKVKRLSRPKDPREKFERSTAPDETWGNGSTLLAPLNRPATKQGSHNYWDKHVDYSHTERRGISSAPAGGELATFQHRTTTCGIGAEVALSKVRKAFHNLKSVEYDDFSLLPLDSL